MVAAMVRSGGKKKSRESGLQWRKQSSFRPCGGLQACFSAHSYPGSPMCSTLASDDWGRFALPAPPVWTGPGAAIGQPCLNLASQSRGPCSLLWRRPWSRFVHVESLPSSSPQHTLTSPQQAPRHDVRYQLQPSLSATHADLVQQRPSCRRLPKTAPSTRENPSRWHGHGYCCRSTDARNCRAEWPKTLQYILDRLDEVRPC